MSFFRIFKTPLYDADTGGGTGSVPAQSAALAIPETPITPPQSLTPSQQLSQLWDKGNVTPVQEPAPAQPAELVQAPLVETPAPEKILGKYENQGELIKAFQSLQGTYTKDHQALLDAQKVIEAANTEKADLEARFQALSQPAPAQPAIPADEFADLDGEAFLQKFYEDPKGMLAKFTELNVKKQVAPIESKLNPVLERDEMAQTVQSWDSATKDFAAANQDMSQFIGGMKQYIQERGLSNSKNPEQVIKDAYIYAKGMAYQTPQSIDPKSYLNDENFMQENIYSNPAIKEKFIKDYMAEVRGQQAQIPNSITGQSNSGAPAMPLVDLKGKPMKAVHEAAANMLFGAK
jgi:hypothetical protein